MSRNNAAFSLPPGDRDDAPFLPPERTGDEAAGRTPEAAAAAPTDPVSEGLRRIAAPLDEAAMALAHVRAAHAAGDNAAATAAAWRLNEALVLVDLRSLSVDLRRRLVDRQRVHARQPEEA